MSYRTYSGWHSKGRHIRPGEKAMGWLLNNGGALFHKDQTEKDVTRPPRARPVDNDYRRPGPDITEGEKIARAWTAISTHEGE